MGSPIIEAVDLERRFPNLPVDNETTIADAIDLERAFPNATRSRSPNSVRVAASEKDKRIKLRNIRRRLLFRMSQSQHNTPNSALFSPKDGLPSPIFHSSVVDETLMKTFDEGEQLIKSPS
jgi:hypothetical protein